MNIFIDILMSLHKNSPDKNFLFVTNFTELSLKISTVNSYNFTNYNETVLINSNFTCGYHIIRQNLYDILKDKYHIICSYDPCSHPGIQCQLYYDSNNDVNIKKEKNKTKMSIMIFRTGSVIIVGKCEEIILYKIYNMFKNILITEYKDIIDNCKIIPTINKIKSKRKIKMINTYA